MEHARDPVDELVDLILVDDQRWANRQCIVYIPHDDPSLVQQPARDAANVARSSSGDFPFLVQHQLDCRNKANAADLPNEWMVNERAQPLHVGPDAANVRNQTPLLDEFEVFERNGGSDRVTPPVKP